jgi:hypothetical protein
MRAATSLTIAGGVALLSSIAIGGCDKLKRNDPAEAGKLRAEAKRQQQACASPSANDHLKNAIFDQAIAERTGTRGNLDILADYSVARMENPVVKGWDPSLDITRCKGRFILEVPPGAERALAGERELRADIDYTAQASADGAGYVYQQKGAEPIVAKLAAFNLGPVAYRPPPAIDEPQAPAEMPQQASVSQAPVPPQALPRQAQAPQHAPAPQQAQARRQAQASRQAQNTPTTQRQPVRPPRPEPSAQAAAHSRSRVVDRTSIAERSPAPPPSGGTNGEATVRAFYNALGDGNGSAASSRVIPEKRSRGAYSPGAMSRFYGRLPEPIRLTNIAPAGNGTYHVTYRYSAGRSRCNGSAVVRLTDRGGRPLIQSIRSLSGC